MVSRSCDGIVGMKCGQMGMVMGMMEYEIWGVSLRGIKGWRCGYYGLGLWVDRYGGDHWGWWCACHQWNGWWNIMGSGFGNHEKWISRESFGRMLEGHARKFHAHGRIEKKWMGNEWWGEWWKVMGRMGIMGMERWKEVVGWVFGYGQWAWWQWVGRMGLGFERKKKWSLAPSIFMWVPHIDGHLILFSRIRPY